MKRTGSPYKELSIITAQPSELCEPQRVSAPRRVRRGISSTQD